MEAEDLPVHDGVKLLLARMESHPEEFEDDRRWAHHYQHFKSYWNGYEKKLVSTKLREIRMQVMHEKIMKELTK
jgi:hypothetical protein